MLAEIHGLSLRARHVVDGFLAGTHRNVDPGTSTEYSQHRPYVLGDDLRHVDWKAFGRTDRLYVRQFLDETNLACHFLLDGSNSMRYQGTRAPWSKLDFANSLIASLAWLLQKQGDAIGVTTLANPCGINIPAATTDAQLARVIDGLQKIGDPTENNSSYKTKYAPGRSSDTGDELGLWARQTRNRHLVVIASDFFCEPTALHQALLDLRQFGHDVILFQICDVDEVEFPFDRYVEMVGMESEQPVTVNAVAFRESYLKKFRDFQQQLDEVCQQVSIHFQTITTDSLLGPVIRRFLSTVNGPWLESN